MKVLIIDDDEMVRLICRMHLESTFGIVDIMEVESGNNANDVLGAHKDFDFIVCDYEMPNGKGNVVYNKLKKDGCKIHFVLHTSKNLIEVGDYTVEGNYHYLQKGVTKKEFIKLIQSFSDIQSTPHEYARIRIPFFYRFNQTLCEVFIQLGPQKYVKIFGENQAYDIDDIEKYVKKDIEYLYIKENDYSKFTKEMESFSFLKFNEEYAKADPLNESVIRQTHALIHDIVLRTGVSEVTINLVNTTVGKIKEITKDRSNLMDLLLKARKNRDYIYDHSYMIACVATQVCKEMSWYTPENIDKLCFSAIFHDLYLSSPRLAKVKTLNDEIVSELSKNEVKMIKEHVTKLSSDFEKLKGIPFEIENIIGQHHETPEANGFPRGLDSSKISPLASIFILSHDFVDLIFEQQLEPIKLQDLVRQLDSRFGKGNFKAPLTALKGMLSS